MRQLRGSSGNCSSAPCEDDELSDADDGGGELELGTGRGRVHAGGDVLADDDAIELSISDHHVDSHAGNEHFVIARQQERNE